MLQGSFYKIITEGGETGSWKGVLQLNAAHRIFDGHFPGQPVVPGVCMMQMVKEILEHSIGRKLIIQKAAQLKFLAIINPVLCPVLNLELKYKEIEPGKLSVTASIFDMDRVYFKFNGVIL